MPSKAKPKPKPKLLRCMDVFHDLKRNSISFRDQQRFEPLKYCSNLSSSLKIWDLQMCLEIFLCDGVGNCCQVVSTKKSRAIRLKGQIHIWVILQESKWKSYFKSQCGKSFNGLWRFCLENWVRTVSRYDWKWKNGWWPIWNKMKFEGRSEK